MTDRLPIRKRKPHDVSEEVPRRVLRKSRSNDQREQVCDRPRPLDAKSGDQPDMPVTQDAPALAPFQFETMFSLLVKCSLTDIVHGEKQIKLITIPLDAGCVTIDQIKDKLSFNLRGALESSLGRPVRLFNFDLFWCKTKCTAETQLDYFLPRHQPLVFHADIKHRELPDGVCMTIFITTLTRNCVTLQVDSTETVAEIKLKLEEKEGWPPQEQRLIFAGKQLEDDRTLDMYNVKNESSLHVVLKLRGGGNPYVSFADVSDSDSLQIHQWSKDAPAWRAASPGLCVEGHCRNPNCKAHGCMVIDNKGMGTFDLVVDAPSVVCPMCWKHVEPETCAFNKCEWRYTGVKADDPAEVVQSFAWTVAGDQYERFSSDGTDKVKWERLLISACYPSYNKGAAFNSECPICLGLFKEADSWETKADPELVTQCGHKYHGSCIEAWKKMGKHTCPLCITNL